MSIMSSRCASRPLADAVAGDGDVSAAAVRAVLDGAVAAVVYKSAIAAVPDSLPFRARFLRLLEPLEFPGRAAREEAVYESVACDFSDAAAAWDLGEKRMAISL